MMISLYVTLCSGISSPGEFLVLLSSNLSKRILARDAFVRMNRRAIAMMFVGLSVCLSVCPSGTCVHCNHTVHAL